MRRVVRRALGLAALLAASVPGAAHATTQPRDAIAALSAMRVANGLPALGIETPEWSKGCRLHNEYVRLNGRSPTNPHDEQPGKPGFTALGQRAARSAVLGAAITPEANGWQHAPLHLAQLLGPGLVATGYDDGCMWTWPGYFGLGPQVPELLTYPGDGVTHYPSEVASEWPFIPQEFVGIPAGVETGPHLYVFAWSRAGGPAKVVTASLLGPDGPVEVRTVDNTTSTPRGNLGALIPPGAILIPVRPLRGQSTYTAAVTLSYGGQELSRTWSFRTSGSTDPALLNFRWIEDDLAVNWDGRSGWKATVRRLPSRTIVWQRVQAAYGIPAGIDSLLRLRGGRYEVCVELDSGAAHGCIEQAVRGEAAGVRLERRGARLARLVAGAAVGRRATIDISKLTRPCRTCQIRYASTKRRQVKLAPTTLISVPSKGRWRVTVIFSQWDVGEELLGHRDVKIALGDALAGRSRLSAAPLSGR